MWVIKCIWQGRESGGKGSFRKKAAEEFRWIFAARFFHLFSLQHTLCKATPEHIYSAPVPCESKRLIIHNYTLYSLSRQGKDLMWWVSRAELHDRHNSKALCCADAVMSKRQYVMLLSSYSLPAEERMLSNERNVM